MTETKWATTHDTGCFARGCKDPAHEPPSMTREQEIILDLFTQACGGRADGLYSHDCISAYEEAQAYLIEYGLIKQAECAFES